jgi:hypothetical protein
LESGKHCAASDEWLEIDPESLWEARHDLMRHPLLVANPLQKTRFEWGDAPVLSFTE